MKTDYTKAKLYYVFLPRFNVFKIGCTSTSLKRRMTSIGSAGHKISPKGKTVNVPAIEGVDYIVKFLREYSYKTAYKYESAIKNHNKDCKVPSDCKPLNNGNSELYWMDIGSTFIDYIPDSDL